MTGLMSFTASGWSLTGAIFSVTLAMSVPPWPSLMVYWNVRSPLKSLFGVNVSVPSGVIVKVPSGSVTDVPMLMG